MKCSELKYGPQKNRFRHVSGLLRFEYSDTFLLNVILLSYLFERISLAALARAERWLTKASPISEDG